MSDCLLPYCYPSYPCMLHIKVHCQSVETSLSTQSRAFTLLAYLSSWLNCRHSVQCISTYDWMLLLRCRHYVCCSYIHDVGWIPCLHKAHCVYLWTCCRVSCRLLYMSTWHYVNMLAVHRSVVVGFRCSGYIAMVTFSMPFKQLTMYIHECSRCS